MYHQSFGTWVYSLPCDIIESSIRPFLIHIGDARGRVVIGVRPAHGLQVHLNVIDTQGFAVYPELVASLGRRDARLV